MRFLNKPELLLGLHNRLDEVIEEIDDEDIVPDRYESNLAALVAENDSRVLSEASTVLHRLYLNARFPNLDAIKGNYVKFDQEVTSG